MALVLALLLLGLARGGPQARAAGDGQASSAGGSAARADPTGSAPSAQMLEFLGSFSTADGHWLDPMALASPAAGGAASSASDAAANDRTGNRHDKSQVDRASERHEQHD